MTIGLRREPQRRSIDRRDRCGHADQANGALKPLVPVPSNRMPNASTFDFVAGDTVRVVLAGWNTLTS